jgi:hypothetical protein
MLNVAQTTYSAPTLAQASAAIRAEMMLLQRSNTRRDDDRRGPSPANNRCWALEAIGDDMTSSSQPSMNAAVKAPS